MILKTSITKKLNAIATLLTFALLASTALAQTGNTSGPGGVPSSTGSRTSTKESSNGMSGSSGSPDTPATTVEAAKKRAKPKPTLKGEPKEKEALTEDSKAKQPATPTETIKH